MRIIYTRVMDSLPISEYLARFHGEALARINWIRDVVAETVPGAEEALSYGIIGWKLHGRPLIYVGGLANHTGLYATPSGHEAFTAEFARFKHGKGSVQFPLNKPLPLDLIRRVIEFRAREVEDELPRIGKPATSALAEAGIATVSDLKGWTEKNLLALHGVGPKAIRLLKESGIDLD